jgi:hypothetical protein
MTLEAYVGSDFCRELHNGQAKLLAGDENNPAPNLLQLARRNLREHFVVVGLTERFDESLILMKRRLGWNWIWYTPRNVASSRPTRSEIPSSTIRLIERTNEKDVELYAFAKDLFEEQIREQGKGFQLTVKTYQLLNRAYRLSGGIGHLSSRGYRWFRHHVRQW